MHDSFKDLMNISVESSDDFFKRLVEEMPGGFLVYRAEGKEEILRINKAALKIFGCDDMCEFQQLTGGTFRGMVHPDDLERVENSISYQIANSANNLDYVEYRIRQKDGSTRWVTDYGRYAYLENIGGIYYVFISDDTERMKKRMSDLETVNSELVKVSARERQYRKAILYDAIFFFEIDLTNDSFITAITHVENIHPFDLFDSLNTGGETKFSDFIDFSSKGQNEPEEYIRFFDRNRLIRCCENGHLEQSYECHAADNLGRRRLLKYVALLGESADGKVSALIMAKDVTSQAEKQKLLQMSLRQAQAANIAKSTFLSNMSHDIKTPLNAILGFTDLIKLHSGDSEAVEEYAEKIKLSGNQLLNILNEALEVTRMESGKAMLAETECHLIDLLAEVEKAMLPEMNAKSIQFMIDKSCITHFSVYIDVLRTKEMLCQLLDNAAKYNNNSGKVILKVKEEVHSGGYGKYKFIVEDNGFGISEEFMDRIFEPFSRENNTTRSGVAGSGLGLAVVKNLVDLMGGTISVESEEGKGSRFSVTLVLKKLEKNIPVSKKTKREISLKGKRLLLAEDNSINCEIAEALLTEEGFIVETVGDGDQAVEAVQKAGAGHFDFILMDIQMPRMNGYEATMAIRALKDKNLANIPIIALSANTYAEDQKMSVQSGMDAHASKPLDIIRLKDIIKSVFERREQ